MSIRREWKKRVWTSSRRFLGRIARTDHAHTAMRLTRYQCGRWTLHLLLLLPCHFRFCREAFIQIHVYLTKLSLHRQRNPEKHLLHEYVHILKHIAGRPTEFLNVRMLFLIRSCLLPSFLCRRVGGSRPVRHTRAVPVDGRHHPGLFTCISRSLYRQ